MTRDYDMWIAKDGLILWMVPSNLVILLKETFPPLIDSVTRMFAFGCLCETGPD